MKKLLCLVTFFFNTELNGEDVVNLPEKEVQVTSKDSNTVYVGRKPTMSYVLAVITNFNSSDTNEVMIKARGRAISTAIDVVEIVRRKFMPDLKVSEITTGTEELQQAEGGARSVSTIEVKLIRS